MTRRQQARPAQLLGVLALLLGLLAMHGLVGGHHAPAATLTAAVTGTGPSLQQVDPAFTHAAHGAPEQHLAVAVMVAPPAVLLHAAGCTNCPVHAMALLCLAVLSTGLALLTLLLARRTRTGRLPVPQLRLPLLRAGPPLRLRPPDLVSQLCVSRT